MVSTLPHWFLSCVFRPISNGVQSVRHMMYLWGCPQNASQSLNLPYTPRLTGELCPQCSQWLVKGKVAEIPLHSLRLLIIIRFQISCLILFFYFHINFPQNSRVCAWHILYYGFLPEIWEKSRTPGSCHCCSTLTRDLWHESENSRGCCHMNSFHMFSYVFSIKNVLLPFCFCRLKKYDYFVLSSELSTKRQFPHQSNLWGLKLWTSPCQPNRLIYKLQIRKSVLVYLCKFNILIFFT